MVKQQKSKFKIKVATNKGPTTLVVGIKKAELRAMSRRELLSLTRALINVRDERQIDFSVPFATPQVIHCAKKVAKMPPNKRDREIAKINAYALQFIYS